MKKFMFVLIVLVTVFTLSGCSSSAEKATDYDYGDEYGNENTDPQEPAPSVTDPEVAGGDVIQTAAIPALIDRKIIYTAAMEMHVLDPEVVYNDIIDVLDSYTAYVESANINSSRYIIKIRVLSTNFDDLVDEIKTSGELVSFVKSSEDITNSYSTFEARLAALEAQHARILELLATAADLDTILELEQARFEIETELNMIGETLATYDSLVDFSTIDVTIRKATEQVVILPRTETPHLIVTDVGRNGAQIEVYNYDEKAVVINMDLYVNGEFIREYEEAALADSKAVITIGDLDSFTEYTVKVTMIADEQRVSYEETIRFETEKTFFNKVTNVFTVSFETLVTIFEFIGLAIVALVPYAVVAVIVYIPLRILRKKGMLKRFGFKPKELKDIKEAPLNE